MPYQYYHREILTGLGDLVGRTVRIDRRTLTSARGKFARIAVEINLKEAVAAGVFLDDVWQDIEYENLPSLCFTCCCIGHESTRCTQNQQVVAVDSQVKTVGRRPEPDAAGEIKPAFGSWLTVQKKA
ncbi:hypothetical protein LINGRAPRIM_LOCUS554 [Linum grandiflorum]